MAKNKIINRKGHIRKSHYRKGKWIKQTYVKSSSFRINNHSKIN